MTSGMPSLLDTIFGKQKLEEVSLDEIYSVIAEFPSFNAAHFLLSKKLKEEQDPAYIEETKKTALYFNNPVWLQLLLNEELNPGSEYTQEPYEETESPVSFSPQNEQPPEAQTIPVAFTETFQPQEPEILTPAQEYSEPEKQEDGAPEKYQELSEEYNEPTEEYKEETVQEYSEPAREYIEPAQEFTIKAQEYTEPVQQFSAPGQDYSEPAREFSEPEQNFHSEPIQEYKSAEPDNREPLQDYSITEQDNTESIREYKAPEPENIEPPQDYRVTEQENPEPLRDQSEPQKTTPEAEYREPAQESSPINHQLSTINEEYREPAQENAPIDHQPSTINEEYQEPTVNEEYAEARQSQPIVNEEFTSAPQPVITVNQEYAMEEAAVPTVNQEFARETDAESFDRPAYNPSLASAPGDEAVIPPPFDAKKADSIVFAPYHMIDYFASQGIKLVLEDQPADSFGKQLKSFTDWLKVMKRLPQKQGFSEKTDEREAERIRHFAANSIEERDILTETMAEVLAKQGMYENAIALYQKLSLIYPPKSGYFASRIEQLKASLS